MLRRERNRDHRALATLAGLGALACATGCVDIRKTHIRTTEEVIETTPTVSAQTRFNAESSLEGSIVRVLVTPRCDEVAMETVEVSDISDRYIDEDEVALLTLLAIVGAAPLGTGTGLLADAPNVYDSDPNGRLYNATGQDAVIATGVILTSVGLAASLPPLINGLRAVGTSAERRTMTRQGATLQENVPCRGADNQRRYAISVRLGPDAYALGTAVPNDPFTADLTAAVLPRLRAMNPPPRGMALWIDDKFQREFPIEPLLTLIQSDLVREDEAVWSTAGAAECAKNKAACAGVQAYLVRFPTGRHAEEAKKLVGQSGLTVAASPSLDAAKTAGATARDNTLEKLTGDARKVFDKAVVDAEVQAIAVCKRECNRVCGQDAACKNQCALEVCQP